MLNPHQIEAIRNAANVISGLTGLHVGSDNSVSALLQQVLGLIEDASSLKPEERGLVDQLIARVYPDADLQQLRQPAANTREPEPPEHVTTQWVIDYLDIARSTFYENVYKHLLTPVKKIGNRPYYLKSEVAALMVRHEKGAWTYSKLRKLKEKEKKEAKKLKKKKVKKAAKK